MVRIASKPHSPGPLATPRPPKIPIDPLPHGWGLFIASKTALQARKAPDRTRSEGSSGGTADDLNIAQLLGFVVIFINTVIRLVTDSQGNYYGVGCTVDVLTLYPSGPEKCLRLGNLAA